MSCLLRFVWLRGVIPIAAWVGEWRHPPALLYLLVLYLWCRACPPGPSSWEATRRHKPRTQSRPATNNHQVASLEPEMERVQGRNGWRLSNKWRHVTYVFCDVRRFVEHNIIESFRLSTVYITCQLWHHNLGQVGTRFRNHLTAKWWFLHSIFPE